MFTIDQRLDCDECEYNGWQQDSCNDYEYGSPPDGVHRDEAYTEGECKIGTSYNFGCWLVKCARCGHIIHNPQIEAY